MKTLRRYAGGLIVFIVLLVAGFTSNYSQSNSEKYVTESSTVHGDLSATHTVHNITKILHQEPKGTDLKIVPKPENKVASINTLRKGPIIAFDGREPLEIQKLSPGVANCSSCPVEVRNGIFCLKEDVGIYVRHLSNNVSCLIEGTDWMAMTTSLKCICIEGWHGNHCSIPSSMYYADYLPHNLLKNIKLREKPRRIITGFPFNLEFDMLETRFAETGDLIDVFVIQESNYTAYGDPKALRLLRYLQESSDLSRDILCKIVYVFLSYFPTEGYYDGWIVDYLQKRFVGSQGIQHQVKHYRHDDIVILCDADEIQSRESLLFLKMHDGYPESFGYNYIWHLYGYFWKKSGLTTLDVGMTMGMLTHVLGFANFEHIRSSRKTSQYHQNALELYRKSGGSVRQWRLGTSAYPAGWHCSWCLSPEDIRNKLTSAQNGDFPRWGDHPEKLDLSYISNLIKNGSWFSGKEQMIPSTVDDAPRHMLKHHTKYKHLLVNPYI